MQDAHDTIAFFSILNNFCENKVSTQVLANYSIWRIIH